MTKELLGAVDKKEVGKHIAMAKLPNFVRSALVNVKGE